MAKQSFITTLKMSQDLETKIMKHNIEYLYIYVNYVTVHVKCLILVPTSCMQNSKQWDPKAATPQYDIPRSHKC